MRKPAPKALKLSEAQVRTLRALSKFADWTGSDELKEMGGSVASLPKLMELELIEERDHPARDFRRQWRLRGDEVQSINHLFPHGLNRWVRIHLWSGGVRTIADLRSAKQDRLLAIPHFGPKSLQNVKETLAAYAAHWKQIKR